MTTIPSSGITETSVAKLRLILLCKHDRDQLTMRMRTIAAEKKRVNIVKQI